MKIQNLAVLFIVLILPISLVLATYTKTRVETISLQTKYDTKLNDATHDALKAYQVNSFTNDTSGYVNSKMRDIEASVNTFFNSMATNFSSLGYTKETLQNYVPALVYTMYDGYYIYAPFRNIWYKDPSKDIIQKEMDEQIGKQENYNNGEMIYGLKPYVYYSCRYKKGNIDVVITYSLDNYIQIQGKIGDETVSKYGYLLSDVKVNEDTVKYKGRPIYKESALTEKIYVDGNVQELQYIKKNGTKYYTDGNTVFTVLDGKSILQTGVTVGEIRNNENAKKYYKEAFELREFIETNLSDLSTTDIVYFKTGKKYTEESDVENPYYSVGNIFEGDVEAKDSNFNTHRIDVIKNSIETNLSVAISEFNNYSGVTTNFQMPKLKDSDWDKIMDNISIISFFQGANIGGKVYNGYSIITNTKNEDVVMEDSIYIKTLYDDIIHRRTENGLTGYGAVGIFNVNLEARSNGNGGYYLPVTGTLSYDSIVTQNNVIDWSNVTDSDLLNIYYTALARERYGLYRPKLEI